MVETSTNPLLQKACRYQERACALVEGELLLHENPFRPSPGIWTRFKLWRASRLFRKVLQIAPHHWQSLWSLGKTVQRLGDERAAFDCFVRAWDLQPGNADVAREAALSAMKLGLARHAVEYCDAALNLEPGEPGLLCNFALALLFAGRPQEALNKANEAVEKDPHDEISQNVLRVIRHIADTRSACPSNAAELDRYCKQHREIFR
jgi:tetratricopeptide (TPR) repeat protein